VAPVWRRVPGNPWRSTRLGAVVAAPSGVAVLEGPAAVVLALLPATAEALATALGDGGDVAAILADLTAHGLVEQV
jgi:hypothetical protein